MLQVTATEFKKNLGKYLEPELFIRQCLGQSESKNEAVDG